MMVACMAVIEGKNHGNRKMAVKQQVRGEDCDVVRKQMIFTCLKICGASSNIMRDKSLHVSGSYITALCCHYDK